MMKLLAALCICTALCTQAFADAPPFLSVTGSGQTIIQATLSDVRIGLEVEGTTVKEVNDRLSARLGPVLSALKKLEPLKLETGAMNINPEYSKDDPPQIAGYRGNIEILFTKEALKAGELIEAALHAGANKLNGVSLKPTEEALRNARIASLQKACQNALDEADIVLKALNLTGKGIKEVDIQPESHLGPIPLAFASRMANAAPALLVTEQEQTITATVTIKLLIKGPI